LTLLKKPNLCRSFIECFFLFWNPQALIYNFKMVQNVITSAVLAYTPPDAPLKEFVPARDRAFFADPEKKSLLSQASAVEELSPYIGTELKGVQLSQLTDAEKDELALLVAEVRTQDAHDKLNQ
jgi:hypothetical protein